MAETRRARSAPLVARFSPERFALRLWAACSEDEAPTAATCMLRRVFFLSRSRVRLCVRLVVDGVAVLASLLYDLSSLFLFLLPTDSASAREVPPRAELRRFRRDS